MRPGRFTAMLADAVNADGIPTKTYAEAGITTSLYGLILSGPIDADVQIAARSATGDDYSQKEHVIMGSRHAPLPRVPHPVSATMLEGNLVALAVAAAPTEVKATYRWSVRPDQRKCGATIQFHDGSAIFLYITWK